MNSDLYKINLGSIMQKKKKKYGVRQTSENLMTLLRDSGSLKPPA